jgi:GNAT superfamily N-acetyltransferase
VITYALEPWSIYYRDCHALWPEHWDEIAVQKDRMPMRPDVAAYQALEAAGRLQIMVVRDDGRMVGYILSVIRPHLHYADVLCGFEDAYFLTKSHRRGMIGVRLISEAVKHMQQVGCKKAFFQTKVALNMGRIFEHMGFENTDLVYSKWIGS